MLKHLLGRLNWMFSDVVNRDKSPFSKEPKLPTGIVDVEFKFRYVKRLLPTETEYSLYAVIITQNVIITCKMVINKILCPRLFRCENSEVSTLN